MLLGFGGPAADAAKVAGMEFTPEGKLVSIQAAQAVEPNEPASQETEVTEYASPTAVDSLATQEGDEEDSTEAELSNEGDEGLA